MRDRSEKPADQCSDNEIGRGLVTDSPAEGHAKNKIVKVKKVKLCKIKNSKYELGKENI